MNSRGGFNTKLGFILAAAGSAVGLGNIWKFPIEVSEGGGAAFLLMYLFFCFILCFPVIVSEIAIGRKSNRNAIGSFQKLGFKKWSFIGKMGVLTGILILSFYSVVAGWVLGYVFEMIRGNFQIYESFYKYTNNVKYIMLYSFLFMFVTAFIVSKGIADGIEKASKILMPSLIFLMIILIIYALTLPNSLDGIKFYLIPDFSQINLNVAGSALGQAFFSLSLGMGMLITYGSYIDKDNNIVKSAALITLADVGIAFLAGLVIFPFIFSKGLAVEGGPGLIFTTLPQIFESLGETTGVLVGSTFFILLTFAALTSTVSLLEVPVSYVVDEYKISRKLSVWIIAFFIFILGIPSLLSHGEFLFFKNFITYLGSTKPVDFMSFIIHVSNDTLLPLGGFLITIFAAYIWKKENLLEEISIGNNNFKNSFVAKYISFSISFICPLILGSLFLITFLEKFFGISFI